MSITKAYIAALRSQMVALWGEERVIRLELDVFKHKLTYTEYTKTMKEEYPEFFFITINPDEKKNTANQFIDRVHKWFQSKSINDGSCYVFEQRGETSTCGMHVHAIVFSHKPLGEIKRDTYNTFKNYVGNKKHVDVIKCPYDWYHDKLLYITEEKHEEKRLKQDQDLKMRNEFNLQQIYYKN